MSTNDLERWRKADRLRQAVANKMREASNGIIWDNWTENPIFQLAKKQSVSANDGIANIEIPSSEWKKWVSYNSWKTEPRVVISVCEPKTARQCITQIHMHDGHVLFMGLGESFGFPNPNSCILRGKLEYSTLFNERSKVELYCDCIEENVVHTVTAMQPHGIATKQNTVTAMLAITFGERANTYDTIEVIGIAQQRCWLKVGGQERNLLDAYDSLT